MSESCCSTKPPSVYNSGWVHTYKPLLILIAVSGGVAAVLSNGLSISVMNGWMGLFLILLATLQLFDLKGFAKVFAGYDPLASRVAFYGYIYPFLELVLGALILSGQIPLIANLVLIMVLAINTYGVMGVISSGRVVRCGCAGTGFTLPVGKVTLAENLAMIAMAGFNILILAFSL